MRNIRVSAHNILCIKASRRKDSQPSGMRVIGDEKLLNIGFLCWKNKHLLTAAATLLQHDDQNRSRASSSNYLQHSSSSSMLQKQ